MDINTALIGLIAVLLIIHYFRQSECRELVRAEVNQTRRDEAARANANIAQAFQVWVQALRLAKQEETERPTR